MLMVLATILLCVLCVTSVFAEETDYSWLDDLTINQLKELDAEIHKRIPASTSVESNITIQSSGPFVAPVPAEEGVKEDEEYVLMFDNQYMTVYAKRYEDKSMLENSTPPFWMLGFKLHIINKTSDKYLSMNISNMTVGNKTLSTGFYGCDYAAPQSEIYTELRFNRLVSEDEKCAFLQSYDEMVDLKGVVQIYYNTDGSRSGTGLDKVNFKMY